MTLRTRTVVSVLVFVGFWRIEAGAQYQPPPGWAGQNEIRPNGYGLGVNSDQYGRPHKYRLKDGRAVDDIFQDGVKRDAYGPGVHMDQFGRPVHDGPAFPE